MRFKSYKPLFFRLLLGGITLSFSYTAEAQQDPYFTHYNFVRPLYNPAVVGLGGKWCAFGIAHSQYMGLEDRTPLYETPNNPSLAAAIPGVGPKTNGAGVSAPLSRFNKKTQTSQNFGGVGLIFYDDRIGFEKNTMVRGQVAFRKTFASDASLSFGADVGFHQKSLDGERLRYIDPNDPFIPTGLETDGNVTASFGVFYQNPNLNKLFVGLSSTNLMPQDYRFGNNGLVFARTARHYYLLAGMEMENFLGNPLLTLYPTTLIKYNAKVQVDATAMVEYMETISGGIGFRSLTDAVSILFGYKVQDIRIGLSYDITLSRLRRVSAGTVELCVNYCWTIIPSGPPEPIPILTPRWIDRETGAE